MNSGNAKSHFAYIHKATSEKIDLAKNHRNRVDEIFTSKNKLNQSICNLFRFSTLLGIMEKGALQMIKDVHQLDLMYRFNQVKNFEISREDLEDMEFYNHIFHLGLKNQKELKSKIKKVAFCKICSIHPRTKHIPVWFLENFYESVVNRSN